MLVRFDPWRELDRWSQQALANVGARPALPMDVVRLGDRVVVHLDLPGVDPESIECTVDRNVLTVRAERSWQAPEGAEVLVAERPQGSFSRELLLGETLSTDRIEARYDGGVLTLTVPVAEAAKPRRVAIHSGRGEIEEAETS
jgi:HSP20 family protein